MSDEQMIIELRTLVNQIYQATDSKTFSLAIEEFLEKYEIWPKLQAIIAPLHLAKESDLKELTEIEINTIKEIEKTYITIEKKASKKNIVLPKNYVDDYLYTNTCVHKYQATANILFTLINEGHETLLKSFVSFATDNKEDFFYRDENGRILVFTISPSFDKWQAKKDELKSQPWLHLIHLMYYNRTKQAYSHERPLIEGIEEFTPVVEAPTTLLCLSQYKKHVKQLYEYTKSVILNKQVKPTTPIELNISYNEKSQILYVNKHEFRLNSAPDEASFALAMTPGGKPFKEKISLQEICDNMFTEKVKYSKNTKDRVYKARDRLTKKIFDVLKIEQLWISVDRGYMLWNPAYKYLDL